MKLKDKRNYKPIIEFLESLSDTELNGLGILIKVEASDPNVYMKNIVSLQFNERIEMIRRGNNNELSQEKIDEIKNDNTAWIMERWGSNGITTVPYFKSGIHWDDPKGDPSEVEQGWEISIFFR